MEKGAHWRARVMWESESQFLSSFNRVISTKAKCPKSARRNL